MPTLNGARIDPKTGDIYFTSIGGYPGIEVASASTSQTVSASAVVSAANSVGTTIIDLARIAAGPNVVLTALTSNTVSISAVGSVSQITAFGTDGILVEGSPITTSGTLNFSLAATGVSPGTFTNPTVTVDRTGRVTTIANGVVVAPPSARNFDGDGHLFAYNDGSTLVFRALVAGPGVAISDVSNAVVISATGGASSASQVTVSNGLTIANAVTVLSFPDAALAVSNGQASVTFPPAQAVRSVGLQASDDFVSTSTPVTSSGMIPLALSNTGVVAGTYNNATLTVDSRGRVRSVSTGTASALSAPVVVKDEGTAVSSSLASINFTGPAATVSSDNSGHVTVAITAPTTYSLRLNYTSNGSISDVANVPAGWSVTLTGSTLTITHGLPAGTLPAFVCTYGLGGSFDGQFTQRVPVGTSPSAFSFTASPSASTFTLYNAGSTNTSAALGSYAILRITV